MRHLINVCFAVAVVLVLAPLAVAADDKVDLTGTWEAEVDIGGQQGMPVFELKQEGDKLTGKYKGQFGEADITGMVDGDKVEFSFEIQDGAIAKYTGTIDGDEMEGETDYAGQASGTWTAKKKEKDE